MAMKRKRKYEKPAMQVYYLPENRTVILAGSATRSSGDPTYNPFDNEQEW